MRPSNMKNHNGIPIAMKKDIRISLVHDYAFSSKGRMPPLGLMYLSASLKKNGFRNIRILDLQLYRKPRKSLIEYLNSLDHQAPQLIGFYMNTPTRFVVQQAIQITKKLHPHALVCAGGPHPTLDREATLSSCEGLDFIVAGEGERTFLESVQRLSENFQVESLRGVAGTSLKIEDQIIHQDLRPRIGDLDDIPFPDRDAVDIHGYRFEFPVVDQDLQKTLKPTTLISSRGCPYSCVFCSVADQWGRMTTYHSPPRVIEEIKILKEQYGFNAFYFFDDTFTLDRNRVLDICDRMLKAHLEIHWFCEIRANTVDQELLSIMYRAGLRSVAIGVESGNPRILNQVIKKGITLDEATRAIKICKKIGIYVKAFFSFSYPGETLDDVRMTLHYIDTVRPDTFTMTKLVIYPGTPLYRHAVDDNILAKEFDWFRYYSSYNSASNELVMPIFIDRLSFKDFLAIEKEVSRLSIGMRKRRTPFQLLNILGRNIKNTKSGKDLIIVLKRIGNYLFSLLPHQK